MGEKSTGTLFQYYFLIVLLDIVLAFLCRCDLYFFWDSIVLGTLAAKIGSARYCKSKVLLCRMFFVLLDIGLPFPCLCDFYFFWDSIVLGSLALRLA